MKYFWHKLTHWEYWPAYLVYTPTIVYWCYLAIKFRSISFYKHANPALPNGGLWGDRKSQIYPLLKQNLYPKTILVNPKENNIYGEILKVHQLHFPLIVKPDIGKRGIDVQKVDSLIELLTYSESINKDFLIQEMIPYSNEMGLFYCRKPNETKGQITGITLKHFLVVEGNGIDSIENLLRANKRHAMQIHKLKHVYDLNQILPAQSQICVVPFGNHNRGTAFFDGKEMISEKLTEVFNSILDPIQGFYYGRLDIRYHSIEDLEQGRLFSIIEINGAKSEPTHIYDPKHSFWYAQKEIFRHQKILKEIVAEQKNRA